MKQNIIKKVVNYYPFNMQTTGETVIQGIRGIKGTKKVYIAGSLINNGTSSSMIGLLYEGTLLGNGVNGTWNELVFTSPDFDDVINTSCYGPNDKGNNEVQIVGSYKRALVNIMYGFLYEGTTNGQGTWTTISPNSGDFLNCFVHSIMGDLAVGNYDTKLTNGFAFIYNIITKQYINFMIPDAYSTTLYGIWHNGGDSYTLAGGCGMGKAGDLSQAFITDWDASNNTMKNTRFYQYLDEELQTIVTHFEGITSDNNGGYNLPCDWVSATAKGGAAFVNIKRNPNNTFSDAEWVALSYPTSDALSLSANTSFENKTLGVYTTENGVVSYCADVIDVN